MTGVPRSRSIAAIWCDSAGCDMCSTAAACVSEPCSTMVTRHSSARIEIIPAIPSLAQRLVFVPHQYQVSCPAG